MSKILHVDSSSRSATSTSRILSKYFVEQWQQANPQDTVEYRDLVAEALKPLSEASIFAMYIPEDSRSPELKAAYNDVIAQNVDQFIGSDVYVLGVPMYNFSVPAAFKSFIDRVVVAGRTFALSPDGFKGLLKNKKAFIIKSSGSAYDASPMQEYDFHEPYLRTVLGFLGITDVTFVRAHGHGEEQIQASIASAKKDIDQLISSNVTVLSR